MWIAGVCFVLAAQPGDDWKKQESTYLKNIRPVTSEFVRAGEGYFSPDGTKIIFQAEERGENPFYQMFVMDLNTGAARRVSPGVGKTTCGYFHPSGKKIIFASSHLDPEARSHYAAEHKLRDEEKKSKKRRRYVWDFDPYMEIFEANLDGSSLKRLTDSSGYDAEGSYSADGKHIVFCSNRSGPKNLELYIMDADAGQASPGETRVELVKVETLVPRRLFPRLAPRLQYTYEYRVIETPGKAPARANVRQLTHAPGCYNGGPFFSPDGKKVIFRSDRKKKDHLQLYVINADGTGEKALTDDENWVFWAPFWYRDGKHIIYTAADHSNPLVRPNYDLYWMNIETGKKTRLTFAPGADVLPVFSPDYTKILWTSNRDGRQPTQLYLADFTVPEEKE